MEKTRVKKVPVPVKFSVAKSSPKLNLYFPLFAAFEALLAGARSSLYSTSVSTRALLSQLHSRRPAANPQLLTALIGTRISSPALRSALMLSASNASVVSAKAARGMMPSIMITAIHAAKNLFFIVSYLPFDYFFV